MKKPFLIFFCPRPLPSLSSKSAAGIQLLTHNFKTHFLSPANPIGIFAFLVYWRQIKISNRVNALRHPKKMENAFNNGNNNTIVAQFPDLAIKKSIL